MMRIISFLLVGILLTCAAAQADTTRVAGGTDLSGDWSNAGSPYIIQGNIHIASRDTLKIGSGVLVLFNGPWRLTVEGVLFVSGNERDSVCFTADTVANMYGWGGIRFLTPSGTSHLEYALIEHGHAMASGEFGYGGGMYCDGASMEMNHCTIRACRAVSGQAISIANRSVLALNGCVITGNGSLSGFGGGIYCRTMSTLSLTDCEMSHNLSLYGGAIAADGCTVTLDGCMILKNSANVSGGGFFCSRTTVVASRSTFLANTSVGGGAIDGRYELYLTMDHCLIESNIAQRQGAQGPGGGLALAGGQQRITNCTFVNNAAGQGGAIWAGTNTRLVNCIFAFQVSGGGVEFPYGGAVVQFCCFAGNADGDFHGSLAPVGLGNINYVNANGDSCDQYQNLFLDPQFDDTSSLAYRLTPDSPCINSGSPATPHDPDGTVADIGAFYYSHTVNADDHFILHPSSFILSCYPNPFNPSTSLRYDIAQDGRVSLRIFDMLGREVTTLVNARQLPGTYSVTWNATFQPSGTYFAVLRSAGVIKTQKLLLLK